MKIDMFGNCPKCGESWDAGDIPKKYRKHYNPPYKYSSLLGIEVPDKYDGVSFYQCPYCKTTWDRWTGEEIEDWRDNGCSKE